MCSTLMGESLAVATPRICMTQPGQSVTTREAPVSSLFFSFYLPISAESSGNFTEKVPPKPQHMSSSVAGT